jgi:LemA protein
MELQPWLILVVGAVLVFWLLGAHNRLVELRNAMLVAGQQLDLPLQQRAAAIAPLVECLRPHLPDESGTFDAVLAAQAQLPSASDALRPRPAQADRAAALGRAEATLNAALARLLALVEHRPELLADAAAAAHVATLRESASRLAFARQLYNDAVRAYNDAARQFPTNVAARLFGFGAAGAL